MEKKICKKCLADKLISDFSKNKNTSKLKKGVLFLIKANRIIIVCTKILHKFQ